MKGILAVATTPALTTSGPPVTAATTVAGPTTTVTVDMYEYRYELSQTSLPSGKVVFVITNRGGVVHNFDLVGVKAGAYLSPGATETWTVRAGRRPLQLQMRRALPRRTRHDRHAQRRVSSRVVRPNPSARSRSSSAPR